MRKKSKIDCALATAQVIAKVASDGVGLSKYHVVLGWFYGYEAAQRDNARKLKALKEFEDDLAERTRFR